MVVSYSKTPLDIKLQGGFVLYLVNMDYLFQKITSYSPDALFYFQDSSNISDLFGGNAIALTSADSRSGIRYGNPYTTKCSGFLYEFDNASLSEKVTFLIVGQFYGGIIFECQGNEISHDGFKITVRNLAGDEESMPYGGEPAVFIISLYRETITLDFDGKSISLDNVLADEADITLLPVNGYSENTTLDIFAVFKDSTLLEDALPIPLLGLGSDRDDIAARCIDSEADGVFDIQVFPSTFSDKIVRKESQTDLPPDANAYKLNWQQSTGDLIYVDGQTVNDGYWNNVPFEEIFFIGNNLESPVTMTYYTDNKLNDQNEFADITFDGVLATDEYYLRRVIDEPWMLDATNYFIDPNWIRATSFSSGGASTTLVYNAEGFARATFNSEKASPTTNTGWNLANGSPVIVPGEVWSGRLQMRTNRPGRFYMYLQFLDSTGSNIGNNVAIMDLSANTWMGALIENVVAPPDAASIRLLAYGYDNTRGWLVDDWLDVRQISLTKGGVEASFSGDTPHTASNIYRWDATPGSSISHRYTAPGETGGRSLISLNTYDSLVGYSFWCEPNDGPLCDDISILAGVIAGTGLYVNGLPYTGEVITSRFHIFVPSTSQEFSIFGNHFSDIIVHESLPDYLDNYLRFFSNKGVSVSLAPFSLSTQPPFLNSPRWTVVN